MTLSSDPIKLSFYGAGYPLFFTFLKYCIFILITLFLIPGIFNIITNYASNDCIAIEELDRLTKKNNFTVNENYF